MAVSAILKHSMTDSNLLQQRIIYKKEDLVDYSPITEKHSTNGMTISDLCAAAMLKSDNTAMNLLIKKLGGIQAVTLFARSIGDKTFRLDRLEPELNSAIPNDPRDTSTPETMEKSLYQLSIGNALSTCTTSTITVLVKSKYYWRFTNSRRCTLKTGRWEIKPEQVIMAPLTMLEYFGHRNTLP